MAARKKPRCRAHSMTENGDERCVREVNHPPPHECPCGFHWTDEEWKHFEGKCGHCGAFVVLNRLHGNEPIKTKSEVKAYEATLSRGAMEEREAVVNYIRTYAACWPPFDGVQKRLGELAANINMGEHLKKRKKGRKKR